MRSPTLSVTLPNYNHGKYIGRSIEAIVSQSRQPDEILILDDGSTDDSVDIIESYARRHSNIRFERNSRNKGVIATLRRLVEMVTGDYICGAAADDYVLPGYYENAIELASLYPQAGIIFGIPVFYDSEGREIANGRPSALKERIFASPEQFLQDYLLKEHPGMTPSAATCYKTSALREVGGFKPELESYADAFAIQAIGLRYGACYFPEPSMAVRIHATTYSGQAASDPHKMLPLISKAASLMRSPEFDRYFPREYVDQWETKFSQSTIDSYVDAVQKLHDAAEIACRYGMSFGMKNRLLSWVFGKMAGLNWKLRRIALRKTLEHVRPI